MNIETKPHRCIFNDVDMKHFMESSTKKGLLNFIEAMGRSCASSNAPLDQAQPLVGMTPAMACLHGALRQMVEWVDDFPPIDQEKVRFGNPAFRQWHQRLKDRSTAIITSILLARNQSDISLEAASRSGTEAASTDSRTDKDQDDASILQVSAYLHDAFGHAVRLDFGTGHESSFAVFLFVLSKVACFGNEAPSLECLRAITLGIFDQYLKVTRKLQTVYRLEPAGSHGVWGLDDYHCLPFYFGACQLSTAQSKAAGSGTAHYELPHELKSPKCFADDHAVRDYGESYLFLSCIQHIRDLKKGVPFFESSPMLFDISQTVPNWEKVARGLVRMYEGEVLDKRQVVQHFLFGKYFPATWTPSQTERQAPVATFRDTSTQFRSRPQDDQRSAQSTSAPPMESTRAPWATASAQQPPPPGSGGDGGDPFQPTKAPWAK